MYADYARKSGDYTTGQKFETTAHNEFAHAKIWYEYIHPCIPTVEKNLEESATGEHYEWTEMYNSYADIARKEGFEEIATKFEQVAAIERNHEKAFTERKTKLENGSAYSSGNATSWICQNCGYQTTGTTAPEICPVCKHNRSYFLNVE